VRRRLEESRKKRGTEGRKGRKGDTKKGKKKYKGGEVEEGGKLWRVGDRGRKTAFGAERSPVHSQRKKLNTGPTGKKGTQASPSQSREEKVPAGEKETTIPRVVESHGPDVAEAQRFAKIWRRI